MAMKTSLIEENFCNQEERERKKNIETIINELMYWIDTKIRDIFYEFDKKTYYTILSIALGITQSHQSNSNDCQQVECQLSIQIIDP